MPPTIRPASVDDLPRVRVLLAQLGYDLEETELGRRYRAVVNAPDHALLVAAQNGAVLGLMHLYVRPALDKPPEVVVQALVVEQTARGTGLGGRLMQSAERWAASHGFASVALTSHIARSDALAFYQRLGYRIEATSHLMRKTLAS